MPILLTWLVLVAFLVFRAGSPLAPLIYPLEAFSKPLKLMASEWGQANEPFGNPFVCPHSSVRFWVLKLARCSEFFRRRLVSGRVQKTPCMPIHKLIVTSLAVVTAFAALGQAPQPKPADKAVTPKLAEKKERKGTKWDAMNLGPFFSGHMESDKAKVNKSVALDLRGATVSFDTELLKPALAWTDGFVLLATGRDGLEGMPRPNSTNLVFWNASVPGWTDAKGLLTDDRPVYAPPGKKDARPYGPLPREHAKWRGIHLSGQEAILSYTVGKAGVLEHYSFDAGARIIRRRLEVSGGDAPIAAVVCDLPKDATARQVEGNFATLRRGDGVLAVSLQGLGKLDTQGDSLVVRLEGKGPGHTELSLWSGPAGDLEKFKQASSARRKQASLASMATPGGPRWGAPIPVPGRRGTVADNKDKNFKGYVVDTIRGPDTNAFNSWIRCSGLDFFSDGTTMAVCSVSGDVWLVRNVDDALDKVTWQRFATGLFQPLGLKIVKDKVYVLGRDQITRLHDANNDGEADYYENFNNDYAAFTSYHEFALDLQVDSKGNFYFAKGGDLGDARHPHHGSVIKISPDGTTCEPYARGLRAPNGMGMGPHDEISVSDNEGNWVPASRFSIVKQGGFYGHVFTAHANPKPTTYDNPVCWLPKSIDNSSGGQVWCTSDKWGPFQGDMLHMSYGHCYLMKVLLDQVDGEYQGGVVLFPFKFETGVMRARFNARDGQLYATGLSVWQSDGAKVGRVFRVRHTGEPVHLPTKLHATKKGLEITFTSPLDAKSVADVQNWGIKQWNYRWTSDYGSKHYKVSDPEATGEDEVAIAGVKLSPDRKTVFLEIPAIRPVMQMKISCNIAAADGTPIKTEVHNSIYRLAEK